MIRLAIFFAVGPHKKAESHATGKANAQALSQRNTMSASSPVFMTVTTKATTALIPADMMPECTIRHHMMHPFSGSPKRPKTD